jgi:Protein of unknown function (DUF2934)
MSSAQARSQKGKATPKMTGRGVPVAANSKQGNSEVCPGSGPGISAQERQMLVARAAYFRAEKRGFAPGRELQDWVEAEAEVLRLIGNA